MNRPPPANETDSLVDYPLSDGVNFDNLAELRKHAEQQIDNLVEGQALRVRFTSLQHSGSAAVALMIAIYRRGHVTGRKVSFVDVPDAVINIIEVSGLSEVLPVAGPSRSPV